MSASAISWPPHLANVSSALLRESEIRDAREPLLHSVILIRGEQFFRAQHAQHVRQIAADLVLPALAAIQGHQQCAHAVAASLRESACRHLHHPDALPTCINRAVVPSRSSCKSQAGHALILWDLRGNALVQQAREDPLNRQIQKKFSPQSCAVGRGALRGRRGRGICRRQERKNHKQANDLRARKSAGAE